MFDLLFGNKAVLIPAIIVIAVLIICICLLYTSAFRRGLALWQDLFRVVKVN